MLGAGPDSPAATVTFPAGSVPLIGPWLLPPFTRAGRRRGLLCRPRPFRRRVPRLPGGGGRVGGRGAAAGASQRSAVGPHRAGDRVLAARCRRLPRGVVDRSRSGRRPPARRPRRRLGGGGDRLVAMGRDRAVAAAV